MKTPNEVMQKVRKNEGHITKEQKASSCCGQTCCGSSHKNKNTEKKEK